MSTRTYLRQAFIETRYPRFDLFVGGWSICGALAVEQSALTSLALLGIGAWCTWTGARALRPHGP